MLSGPATDQQDGTVGVSIIETSENYGQYLLQQAEDVNITVNNLSTSAYMCIHADTCGYMYIHTCMLCLQS